MLLALILGEPAGSRPFVPIVPLCFGLLVLISPGSAGSRPDVPTVPLAFGPPGLISAGSAGSRTNCPYVPDCLFQQLVNFFNFSASSDFRVPRVPLSHLSQMLCRPPGGISAGSRPFVPTVPRTAWART